MIAVFVSGGRRQGTAVAFNREQVLLLGPAIIADRLEVLLGIREPAIGEMPVFALVRFGIAGRAEPGGASCYRGSRRRHSNTRRRCRAPRPAGRSCPPAVMADAGPAAASVHVPADRVQGTPDIPAASARIRCWPGVSAAGPGVSHSARLDPAGLDGTRVKPPPFARLWQCPHGLFGAGRGQAASLQSS